MTPTKSLVDKFRAIFMPGGFLDSRTVERTEQAEMAGYAVGAREHMLLLGDPGVGKTMLLDLAMMCLTDARMLKVLLIKDMSSDEILGPKSIQALKQDKIARSIDGFLPSVEFAYLDEFFKCNPTALNSLLGIMVERHFSNGGTVLDCPLVTLFASSNELPEREDLMAIRDRLGITLVVDPVRTPEGRKEIMRMQAERDRNPLDPATIPHMTLTEVAKMHTEIDQVDVPEVVVEAMDSFLQKCLDSGFPPSMRRVGSMIRVLKSRAWTDGRNEVMTDDMVVLQHMAWNDLESQDEARQHTMEFANVFTKRAARAMDALETIKGASDELKKKFDEVAQEDEEPSGELLNEAFEIMRDLRKLRKETKREIGEGESQQQDVSELQKVMTEIASTEKWARSTFTDEEDDDDES